MNETPLPLASSSRPPPQGGRRVIAVTHKFASPLMGEAGAKRRVGVTGKNNPTCSTITVKVVR